MSVVILISAVASAQSPLERPASSAAAPGQRQATPVVTPNVSSSSGINGSVPTGDLAQSLDLSLRDALSRALKYNLALIEGGEDIALTRANRLRALSQILPTLNIRPSITEQQINLASFGLSFPGVPSVVGPFHIYDARAYGAEQFGLEGLRNYRAGKLSVHAAELSLKDSRDQVVQVVVQLYLQSIAGAARIAAERAQVATAQSLYTQAVDRKNAGTVPAIDVLRAQVELQSRQQLLILYEGNFEKQKLALARAIGLPLGQQFRLADTVPYVPLPDADNLDESLKTAYQTRSDFQASETQVRAADLAVGAASAGRYPTASLTADYGTNGLQPNSLHGSFTLAAGVNIPVFQAGRTRANVEEAEAQLRQRRAEHEDLRGRIDADVRNAFLDLRSSSRQVEVARNNLDLARQTVQQSQDRFSAGVTNNVEVVQAQEALATAEENYISALFAFNSAKASLARARGDAEESIVRLLNIR
jgi:outer membrane protein TolC